MARKLLLVVIALELAGSAFMLLSAITRAAELTAQTKTPGTVAPGVPEVRSGVRR